MTPTETIRALLDERGIAWFAIAESGTGYTMDGVAYRAYEIRDGLQVAIITPVTPEQAIAATVGSGYGILQSKVEAQGDYIYKLRGEYRALDEQMERRCSEYRDTIRRLKAELDAVTVGNSTDLSKRLREVHGLHAFAELFGFDWTGESDWTWHDVACSMANAVDAATEGRSCASCPEMDNPDSYISHLQSALKWHDEHVPRPTNPRNTCVVMQGERPPEEVLFVREDGEVTHYHCDLNEWTTYVVEDLVGEHLPDNFHEIKFLPKDGE